MEITYKSEDFTPHGIITKDVIEHVLENVEDFEPRYYIALGEMEFCGCGLRLADESLFYDIHSDIIDLLGIDDRSDEADDLYDKIEEVFG